MRIDDLERVSEIEYREWMTRLTEIFRDRDTRIDELRRQASTRASPEGALALWSRPVRLEALRKAVELRLQLREEYALKTPGLLCDESLATLRVNLDRFIENAVADDQRSLAEAGDIQARMRVSIDKLAVNRPVHLSTEGVTNAEPSSQVFISYSWDNPEHKAWVLALAIRLRGDGIDAILDQTHLPLGARSPEFMERSVRQSRCVLVVCTENYKRRFDNREGGAGYEGHIITGEIVNEVGKNKFIPVLRSGDWKSAMPTALSGTHGVDLRRESHEEYRRLAKHLHGITDVRPVGPRPEWLTIPPKPEDQADPRVSFNPPAHDRSAVRPATAQESHEYWEQRKRLPETAVLKKIYAKPRWQIWIRPAEFRKARFQDLEQCREFIHSSYVRFLGEFPFPSFSADTVEMGDESIAGEIEISEGPVRYAERWVLFRSGQFVQNRAISEIPQIGDRVHALHILDSATAALEFSARMARRGILTSEAAITFDLHGVDGRRLTWPQDIFGGCDLVGPQCWCQDENVNVERCLAVVELESRRRELALEVALDIYSKFGWSDAPRDRLELEQKRRFGAVQ